MIYKIGRIYRYPGSKTNYVLKRVNEGGWMFEFECGKKVTDNVFCSMIDTTNNTQVCLITQTELF